MKVSFGLGILFFCLSVITLHCLSVFYDFFILFVKAFGKHEEIFGFWKCVYSFGICVRLCDYYYLTFIGLHDYCIFCYKLLLVTKHTYTYISNFTQFQYNFGMVM